MDGEEESLPLRLGDSLLIQKSEDDRLRTFPLLVEVLEGSPAILNKHWEVRRNKTLNYHKRILLRGLPKIIRPL